MTTATTERPALTERQAEILEYMRSYSCERGAPPTYREIAARFGFAAHATGPVCHLTALVRKGYLRRTGKRQFRAYALAVEPGCCACCGQPLPEEDGQWRRRI